MKALASISAIVVCLVATAVPVALAQEEANENWFRVDII